MMRRRIMMSHESELPNGYTRCEYLQGVGSIKTYFVIPEIDITDHPYVILDVAYPQYTKDTNAFGSILNEIRFEHGIGWNGDSFSYNYGNGYGSFDKSVSTSNGLVSANSLSEKRIFIEYKNDNFYIDGIDQLVSKSDIYAPGQFGVARNVFVFGTNRGSTKRYFSGRIYRFCVENQIALIPSLDTDGVPCMFDLVSRKPFYNQGTGEFLYKLV